MSVKKKQSQFQAAVIRGDKSVLSASKSTPPGTSRRRRWWYPIAALSLPFVVLLLLEVLLRIFGYGYATHFFLRSRLQGREVFIENQDFTRRFFPPGLERAPQPLTLAAVKPPDTCRIFIFGESAAMGDPEPAFGFGRILETLLRGQFPGHKFEVVNVAVTAINSHVIRHIARDCAPRQGDIWLIYMGNNEVVGPFGAGTVFGAQTPSLTFIRASLAFQSTRTGQFLEALKWKLGKAKGRPATWEGMEMFLDQQLREDDRRMAMVYANFEKNLADLLKSADACGAKVLLSTVVSNLKDCAPYASLHRLGLSAAQLAEWNTFFQTATHHEAAGNYGAALAQYQRAAALDDRHAELHFRLGRCQWALGSFPEAKQSFERARDLDTLRFRADSRLNASIKQAAAASTGANLKFVDAVEVVNRNSPHDIAGAEFLFEHVHLNFQGNYLLARTFAEEIASWLATPITTASTNRGPLLSAEDCARRLAYTDWDRYQLFEEMVKRLELPPFTHQLDHTNQIARFRSRRVELEPALRSPAIDSAIDLYRQALALAPEDWVLHENFAKLLEFSGDLAGTEEQWRQVLRLLPHNLDAYYRLGNILDSRGRSLEAIAFFQQALRRKPDLIEARNGLGLALANLGRISEAVKQYENALRRKPEFAEAHVNLGQILARQGKVDEAIAQYHLALRCNSNSAGAHINLGKALAGEGKVAEAVPHYQAAIALKPDNAVAHYNLGNALAALGKAEAASEYAEAVKLRPEFVEARFNLGLALAQQGRSRDALAQFVEVVRLKPDSADAHLNLGVALAQERRYPEAVTHFEATLRLDPNNAAAKQYLEKAQALLRRTQ